MFKRREKNPLVDLYPQPDESLPILYLGRKEEDLDLIKRYGKMQREKELTTKKQTVLKAKTKSKGKTVETEMEVKKDISDKMKRAIKKSVIAALENELKGAGLFFDSDSDSSSSDEESIKPIKRRGRPKKKLI